MIFLRIDFPKFVHFMIYGVQGQNPGMDDTSDRYLRDHCKNNKINTKVKNGT